MNDNALADRLQLWGIEDDFLIFTDGSLGFGVDAVPLDVSCLDDVAVNNLAAKTRAFLNGLPEGLSLQFVQDIEGGNAPTWDDHRALGAHASSEVAGRLVEARVRRLAELDAVGLVPRHTLKIFARRSLTKQLVTKSKLFSKPKLYQPMAKEVLAREIASMARIKDDMVLSLTSLGLVIRPLLQIETVDLLYRQWNPDRPVGLGRYDPQDIRSSLLFTDAVVAKDGFALGRVHHRILSLKTLPNQTFAAMAGRLRELPFGSRLLVTVNVPQQEKELEKLQTQRRVAYSMVMGRGSGVRDIESQAKLTDIEALLEQMIAQGEKVFTLGVNIILKAGSEDELDGQVSQTLMKLRELGGAEAMAETVAAFEIFTEAALPNARIKERSRRLKTSNLADFLPIYGPWRGHQRPSILLRSRLGSLVSFDPFATTLTNANQIVSGGSGSGKSYLTNILLLQMLAENPRIFIVDIGGSYRKMTDIVGGQYIPLGVDVGMTLNPFDLSPGEKAPDSAKIKFLVGLIEIMTKESDEAGLKRLERAEVEDAIARTYQGEGRPSLSKLRALLASHSDPTVKRLGRVLAPWCGDTPFGRFVDRDTTIALERSVVCFDLKGLDSYPDLQAACLFMITDYVWREVQHDRCTKKFLVFDEVWKLLENEAGAAFISDVFRTFRKYFASAVAISQNIDDFAKSRVAAALLPNAAVKWVLRQKGADQARLREVLSLNDNEMHLVQSLHQEKGVYSEALLLAGDDRSLVAIESTPLEYWIATTDPRETAAIQRAAAAAPEKSKLQILEDLAAEFPRGLLAKKD